ncbi:MAG: murein biosynthesis integral membrane protein MurJ [Gammaproteobacteria bacterium WSBS_2016_MAG_OTU1]
MKILSAFLSVSGWTFGARILGLVRDVTLASIFGAGALMDAFFAAYRLPNTLRRFTAEGALTQAFVPVYRQSYTKNRETAALFAGDLLFILTAALSILTAIVMFAAPHIILVLAPGLEETAAAASMLRIVFPYIVLISMVALFAGMLNAVGRFRAAAAMPMILNICLIAAALWLAPRLSVSINALAFGVLGGGVLQLLFMIFCIRRAGLSPQIRPRRPTAQILTALKRMGLSSLGAGAAQINILINLGIASLLPAGSISWLYYADRLMELPAGMLGAALATVALPALSGSNPQQSRAILDTTLRLAILLAMPAAVGLAVLASPIVNVLFMHGAFSTHDAEMTTLAVIAYSIGTIGLVAIRPLAAAFFSRGDAATPAKTAAGGLLFTQLLNVILIYLLQWNHAGLALSIGLGATFNALLLFYLLRRRQWYTPMDGWRRLLAAVVAAAVAMAAVLWLVQPAADFWLEKQLWLRVATLGGLLILAAGVYFAILRACGIRIADFSTAQYTTQISDNNNE